VVLQQLSLAVGAGRLQEGWSPRTSEAAHKALTGAKRRYGARTSVRALHSFFNLVIPASSCLPDPLPLAVGEAFDFELAIANRSDEKRKGAPWL